MKLILPKKISWLILTSLFTFDAVVSYIAVTRMHGREADLMIAFAVEKYPLLYFVTIPGLIIIMYFIAFGLIKLAMKFFNKKHLKREIIEQIVLTSMVIFWPVANSYMNLSFIFGHRLTIPIWYKLNILGFVLTIIYFVYTVSRFKVRK